MVYEEGFGTDFLPNKPNVTVFNHVASETSEAVFKFWATGKMLKAAWKKNKKKKKKAVDPEIAERAAVLANLKQQIATAKVNAQRAATIEAQKKITETQ